MEKEDLQKKKDSEEVESVAHKEPMEVMDQEQFVEQINDQAKEQSEIVYTKKKWSQELWDWTKAIGIAVILAIVIRTFFFAPTVVDGQSMMSTLENGEFLIVNKIVYRIGEPKRGDIIIFHATEKKDYIKRVIGIAGDRIEMKDDQLVVNGNPLPEPYLEENIQYWHEMEGTSFTQDFIVQSVPEGTVYVLGDNRRNSTDSRIIGSISLERVVGRADISLWPLKSIRFIK